MKCERLSRTKPNFCLEEQEKELQLLWWGTLRKDWVSENIRSSNSDLKFGLPNIRLTYIKLVILNHSDLQKWKLYIVQLNRYLWESAGDAVGYSWERYRRLTEKKKIRSTTGSWDIPAFIMRSKQIRKLRRRETDNESVRSWMARGEMFKGDKDWLLLMKTELTPGFNKAGIIGDLMRALIDDWYRQKSDQSAFKR